VAEGVLPVAVQALEAKATVDVADSVAVVVTGVVEVMIEAAIVEEGEVAGVTAVLGNREESLLPTSLPLWMAVSRITLRIS
jgi:hypothetical protein